MFDVVYQASPLELWQAVLVMGLAVAAVVTYVRKRRIVTAVIVGLPLTAVGVLLLFLGGHYLYDYYSGTNLGIQMGPVAECQIVQGGGKGGGGYYVLSSGGMGLFDTGRLLFPFSAVRESDARKDCPNYVCPGDKWRQQSSDET